MYGIKYGNSTEKSTVKVRSKYGKSTEKNTVKSTVISTVEYGTGTGKFGTVRSEYGSVQVRRQVRWKYSKIYSIFIEQASLY